ncbi:hypothetical protein JHK86_003895 [Glycine max]|nr:hypothetical protein JHK86_003895 [Glycine max]
MATTTTCNAVVVESSVKMKRREESLRPSSVKMSMKKRRGEVASEMTFKKLIVESARGEHGEEWAWVQVSSFR